MAAAHPLALSPEAEAKLLRFVLVIATQYWGRGAAWEALLRAGYTALLERATNFEKEPDAALGHSAFWVRNALAKLLPDNALGEDGRIGFSE